MQGTKQHKAIVQDIVDKVRKGETVYRLVRAIVPQSAGLADALMKDGFLTFTQKYTSPIISQTLMPLVQEVKGLL